MAWILLISWLVVVALLFLYFSCGARCWWLSTSLCLVASPISFFLQPAIRLKIPPLAHVDMAGTVQRRFKQCNSYNTFTITYPHQSAVWRFHLSLFTISNTVQFLYLFKRMLELIVSVIESVIELFIELMLNF